MKLTNNQKALVLAVFFGSIGALKIFILRSDNFFISHLSNFGLTGLLLSSSLFSLRKYDKKKSDRDFKQALVVCVALNLILELGGSIGTLNLPFGGTFENFNIADPLDAVFGLISILIVVLIKKYWRINQ